MGRPDQGRGSLIKKVHLQHAIATQQHDAPVGCTQALCWSPVQIFSAIQALFQARATKDRPANETLDFYVQKRSNFSYSKV